MIRSKDDALLINTHVGCLHEEDKELFWYGQFVIFGINPAYKQSFMFHKMIRTYNPTIIHARGRNFKVITKVFVPIEEDILLLDNVLYFGQDGITRKRD